jgi:diguanylate cyclase (GGDEF)-like protein
MNAPGPLSDTYLESLPDNVLVTDHHGKLVQANERARETLALGAGPWTVTLTELFPFRDQDLGPSQGGDRLPFEDIARGLDGRELRVLVRVSAGEAGSQLWLVTDLTNVQDDRQGMIDFMADLTTAQAKIREYTRQIEVFRRIVDGMDQGIVLTDADQKVAFANAFANTLFGTNLGGLPVATLRNLISSASEGMPHDGLKGEVLVLDENRGRQTRCYLNVAPLSRDDDQDHNLVWTFFELTEEIANTQAFIDFSAELALLNRDLRKKHEEILHLSRTDVLTGIANRRSILEMLERAVEFGAAHGQDVSVILFDVDRFKEVNDQFGHLAGDDILRSICRFAGAALDQAGTLGRYGGEEFLVVLPGADLEQARILAEELRVAVQKGTQDQGRQATVTLGVAAFRKGQRVDELLSEADRALYQGKETGRNRVVVAH